MEKKRAYERPELRKVRLDVKSSVLGFCHQSNTLQAVSPTGCTVENCYATP